MEKTMNQKPNFFKRLLKPDAYVLLFCILIICAIATYILPAGEFKHVPQGDLTVTVPGSYHAVASNPTGFMDFFMAIQTGMVKAAPLIFLILFTGGALKVLEKTGAINAAIAKTVKRFQKKEILLIIVIGVLFSVLGTTGVVVNSIIAFVPLGIIIARAMKLDAIFGVSLIYLGAYAGFNASMITPSTLGLSQKIAELPILSGIGYRAVIYTAFVIATLAYIYIYMLKLRKNPDNSLLGNDKFPLAIGDAEEWDENQAFTTRQKWMLTFAGLTLLVFVICTIIYKLDVDAMTAMFVFMAVGSGLIAGMKANDISKTFLKGCQRLVAGALIVGMARAVVIILGDGKLIDTIVNVLAHLLQSLPPVFGAVGMFLGSAGIHFLISSGSGESAMIVPILVPLADLMHITRQVAVEAVILGEGVVNCINPTSGVLMGVLAASGIAYGKWVRFMLPLVGIWIALSIIFIVIGVLIGWGPA
ncbi:YfcC family protein [Shimazuella sp. AN120528]|uniref:YfcC family protein n=1 Tax=Shimazuella soli TaxID=1892854 RepID=UPI001F113FAC|nr:Na+/H+ antiporter NhaC family protein [Shimazuella soli]MCH5584970.1 YfcC family protein [Shimazuella soli]